MPLLNQVIAVVASKKKLAADAITGAYHTIQKPPLFDGLVRTYTPRDEDGEQLPKETNRVQATVQSMIDLVQKPLIDMFDVVFTQDCANCEAKGTLKVGDTLISEDVPVSNLLFLEKQAIDLIAFVSKLPTLDPSEAWTWDDATNSYRSEPSDSVRTKKTRKPFVKYEATKEHPAQVDVVDEDVVVGVRKTIKFSGALKSSDKAAMLDRARKLHEAIVKTREACNSKEVAAMWIGESILDFVFKGE